MANELPKIQGTLVGVDGNAFSLMGAFKRDARKAGWPQSEIDKVLEKAMSGNYDNLIATLDDCYEG